MEKSKLTAYALNEVSEAERAEIELYLNSHPHEKAEVEEIKLVSSILKSEMATDLVVTAPALPAKKASFWSALMRPRVLAAGFSLFFVGIVSAVLIGREAVNQAKFSMAVGDSSVDSIVGSGPATGRVVDTRQVRPQTTAMAEKKIGGISEGGPSKESFNEEERQAVSLQSQVSASSGATAEMAAPSDGGVVMGGGSKDRGAPIGYSMKAERGSVAFGSAANVPSSNLMARESLIEPGRRPMPTTPPPGPEDSTSGEEYKLNAENDFIQVSKEALSTFSIDVDTASYSNARRYLTNYTQIPPADSIRTEEFVNYFDYDYKAPTSGHPIAVLMEATKSPWNQNRAIVRIGLKGKEIEVKDKVTNKMVKQVTDNCMILIEKNIADLDQYFN